MEKKAAEYPSDYWIPDLPEAYISAWNTINPLARQYYQTTALPDYRKRMRAEK